MLHKGHRERLRSKALDFGMECLEEHEALELLLGYCIPRRNTNEIAHELINKAGSLIGVFDMDFSEICKINGMGIYGAFMLKLIGFIMKRPKAPPKKRVNMSKYSYVKEYAKILFSTAEKEELYVFLLDKKLNMISCVKVDIGSEWQLGVDKKFIFKRAVEENAAAIIFAHNHPGGFVSPSADDLSFTVEMERACNLIDLRMVEHII
ncbi:MAG: hypothetical protein IJW79_03685, partial [Clostridia bacterium]|nr:hypothetical protein [Clostridia bacterium]